MARAAVSASLKLFSLKSSSQSLSSISATVAFSTFRTPSQKRREKEKKRTPSSAITLASTSSSSSSSNSKLKSAALEVVKRRTRSEKEFDEDYIKKYGDEESHIPVMLGEILDVFPSSSFRLRSFVDCTLGAGGHSCAVSFLSLFYF